MHPLLKKITVIALPALMLAGCTQLDETKETGEAGLTPEEMEQINKHGVGGPGDFSKTPLSGPGGSGASRVIYFEYDSDEIKPEYQPVVEASAAYLASHPNAIMTLEGHADERGSREYNLALGERRALAVRRQLNVLGGSSSQIRTVSFGEEKPASEGHDESAYAMNRRVEISY